MRFKKNSKKTKDYEIPILSKRWNEKEHNKMFNYLHKNREQILTYMKENIDSEVKKYRKGFYKDMAKFIQTKNEHQCKSRFQKKELKMYEALGIPKKMMNKYFAKQKIKNKISQRNPSKNIFIQKIGDDKCNMIKTYDDFKNVINNKFVPCIKNQVIKDQVIEFVNKLYEAEITLKKIPSLYLDNIDEIVPYTNTQTNTINDYDLCSINYW